MKWSFILCTVLYLFGCYATAQDFVQERTLRGQSAVISAINFRSEDNLLASGGEDGKVIIWNTQNGQLLKTIEAHSAKISHIAFSNGGELLVTAGYDGQVRIWKATDFTLVKAFQNPKIPDYAHVNGNEPTFAVFAPDDKSVYFGGYNMKICQGTIVNGNIATLFTTPKAGITCGMLSPDNQYLAFGYAEKLAFLDLATQEITKEIAKSNAVDDYVCEVSFVPNTDLVAFWGYGGKAYLFDWQTETLSYTLPATTAKGTSNMAFSEDSRYAITGNDNNKTKIWDITTQRTIQTLEGHTSAVGCFAFSQNGELIVTAGTDKQIILWKKRVPPPPPPTVTTTLEDREVITQQNLTTTQDNIDILVWDRGQIDGDIVSLNLNGVWVLQDYELTKNKKKITLSLKRGNNAFVLYAHNEGRVPPNTIAIAVKEGRQEKILSLRSNLRTCGALNIQYNPE